MSDTTSQDQANALTREGIALMEQAQWQEALEKFDAAIAIRDVQPWQTDSMIAWGLAAGWINRSDALYFTGRTAESVASLDRSIEVMGALPLEETPAFVDRLLLAWINRASRCGELGDRAEAEKSFAECGALLERWGSDVHESRRMLTAMCQSNHARFLLSQNEPAAALPKARAAVEVLAPLPTDHPAVADAAIASRCFLCITLAQLVDVPGGTDLSEDWIAEATDAAEDALDLVRQHGFGGPMISDLVRYGAMIYRRCQPHFLAEFIGEWMEVPALHADEALRNDLQLLLQAAQADAEQRVIDSTLDETVVAKQAALINALTACSNWLAAK